MTGRVEGAESALEAASRELREETGAALVPQPLDYQHSFALGEALPPVVVQETAFFARWPGGPVARSAEHCDHAWLSVPEAMAALPFKGLKETLRRAVERAGAPSGRTA